MYIVETQLVVPGQLVELDATPLVVATTNLR